MNQDEEHLKLLTIFHYVLAGITAMLGCCPMIHVGLGIAALSGALKDNHGQPMPMFFGLLFVIIPGLFILAAWTLALLMLLAGGKLKRRTGYTFCLVVAGIECLFMPFGTVLGVFSIIVLLRPTVKTLFGQPVSTPPAG